jgi:3-oxoacyl-[acyl-carrier protein] reductase
MTSQRVALIAGQPDSVASATKTALENQDWLVVRAGPLETAEDAIRHVTAPMGKLDLLIAGRGRLVLAPVDARDASDWWKVVDANLGLPFRLARAAAPRLRESKGSIVFIGSDWGGRGLAGGSAFSAGTAGLVGLMRALARELAPVRVNVVAPGDVDPADIAAHAAGTGLRVDEVRETQAELSLLGRLGTPQEVAEAVVFLSSAAFFTGQVLSPIGGRRRG